MTEFVGEKGELVGHPFDIFGEDEFVLLRQQLICTFPIWALDCLGGGEGRGGAFNRAVIDPIKSARKVD